MIQQRPTSLLRVLHLLDDIHGFLILANVPELFEAKASVSELSIVSEREGKHTPSQATIKKSSSGPKVVSVV
jgi:hypothetical protein